VLTRSFKEREKEIPPSYTRDRERGREECMCGEDSFL
jgi:hypothetical protein